MGDDIVQVKFGADVAGLVGGTQAATGELNKILQAIALLQKSVHASSQAMTSELTGAIRGMGAQATAATPQIRKMAEEVQRLSTAGHGGHGTIFGMQSGVFLELRALLDEALAGRMRNFEGSFARLMGMLAPAVQGFAAANPLLASFGAAAAAAAVSVGFLAYRAYEAQSAVGNLRLDAAVNQFQMSEAAAGQLRDSIERLANVGASDAEKIARPFTAMGAVGATIAQMVAPIMKDLATQMGGDVAKAAEEVAKRFTDIRGAGLAFVNASRSMTDAEKQHFAQLVASGHLSQAYAILVDLTSRSLEALKHSTEMATAAQSDHVRAVMLSTNAGYSLEDAEKMVETATAKATANINEESSSLTALRSQLLAASTAADTFSAGMAAAMKADKVASEIKETQAEIAKLQAGMNVAPDRATDAVVAMGHSLDLLKEKLKDLHNQQSDPVLGENKGDLAQYEEAQKLKAAQSRETREQILREEIASNRAKLADANLTEKEKQKLTLETAEKERQLFESQTKAGKTAASDQRGATEAEVNGEIAHIEAQTQHTIAQLDMQVKLKQITEDKKAGFAIAALKKEESAVDALFAKELALAGLTLTKKQEITDKQQAYDDRVAKEIFAQQAQAAEASAKVWDSAAKTINSAFDSQINGLLRGTTSWGQALKNVLASLSEDIIKFFVNWALQAAENEAKQLALQATGVAAHKALNAVAVSSDAGKAAAGAYSAVSGIPIIGPVLAPVAAAVAFGAVEAFGSYDVGSWSLPGDMLAQVHQGEMIVPAAATPWAQSLMANAAGGGGGGNGGGGGYTHHGDIISNASDARQVAREVAALWNRNPSMRPAF